MIENVMKLVQAPPINPILKTTVVLMFALTQQLLAVLMLHMVI